MPIIEPEVMPTASTEGTSSMPSISSMAALSFSSSLMSSAKASVAFICGEETSGMKDMLICIVSQTLYPSSATASKSTSTLARSAPRRSFA